MKTGEVVVVTNEALGYYGCYGAVLSESGELITIEIEASLTEKCFPAFKKSSLRVAVKGESINYPPGYKPKDDRTQPISDVNAAWIRSNST